MVEFLGTDIPRLGLGGVQWSITDDRDDGRSKATIRDAVDLGVRLIDTARAYTTLEHESHNEDLIAEALRVHPNGGEVIVATKGGHFRAGPDSFPKDGRPETLRDHCIASMRHLGVDCIRLYQLHHPDPNTPVEISVGELERLRIEGKIANIGMSNVSLDQLEVAMEIAPIASVQNEYSLFNRASTDVLEFCEAHGLAFLAYAPLGGSARVSTLSESDVVRAVAGQHDSTEAQVALAWLLAQSSSIIPLVGTRRLAGIAAAIAALSLTLGEDDLNALSGAF